jgi:hypothetical protein
MDPVAGLRPQREHDAPRVLSTLIDTDGDPSARIERCLQTA